EATIAEMHTAMRDGRLTARRLVDTYLARIDAYDKRGPRLNALIAVSADARHAADSLDAVFARTGNFVGRASRHSDHRKGQHRHQGYAEDGGFARTRRLQASR